MPRHHSGTGSEWRAATFRSGDPWTPAEERRLQEIYARPRRVKWLGTWRRPKGMYHAAKVLGRSPSACALRWSMLQRFRRK